MSDYRLVETTKEVGHAIRKAHPELKVFSCFTEAIGNCFAMTAWGFEGCDFPILRAETTADPNGPVQTILVSTLACEHRFRRP